MKLNLQVPYQAELQAMYRYIVDLANALQLHRGTIVLPSMTTTERDALTAAEGMIIYNTTDVQVQVYENSAWRQA